MADTPPIPTIPTIDTSASVENLQKLDAATKSAGQSINYTAAEANLGQTAFNLFGNAANSAGHILSSLQNKVNSFSQSMRQSASLTSEQTKQFSLLNVMLIGARQQFEGLSNVDFSGMSTFGEQIEFIKDTVGDSATAINKLASLASSMGQELPEAFRGSVDMAAKFVSGLARSADNAVRLRTAYLQLASQTGELGKVYQTSGSHLENLNLLVAQQQKSITDTAQATGMSASQVEKYYSQLAAIPKAMEATVQGGRKGVETVSMLTAVMQFAAGSGRKYGEVIEDIHEAFRDFKITGQDALNFTSRMTEITNKFGNLGLEFKDVRNGLLGMSREFKEITNAGEAAGKMTEHMSQMMGDYIDSLVKTGMSSGHAIDVIKTMTGAVSDLRIEQKAFLSAQTGGPGGLMGGFQIEKMMRDGDIQGVMDKIQTQMKKQFGRFVTLDEATQSPQAASELMRQMTILKSGPLGQFAKTDQDAYRMLEAFKQKDEGKINTFTLDSKALTGTMDKGIEIQQKTYTEISKMRGLIEASRGIANIGSVTMLEEGFSATAGTFANTNLGDPNVEARAALRDNMSQNSRTSGETVKEFNNQLTTGKAKDVTGIAAAQSIEDYKKFFTELPNVLSMNFSGIYQSILGENNERMLKETNSSISFRKPETTSLPVKMATNNVLNIDKNNKSDQEVKSMSSTQIIDTSPQKVKVEISGFCLKCKSEYDHSHQMSSSSPAAGK